MLDGIQGVFLLGPTDQGGRATYVMMSVKSLLNSFDLTRTSIALDGLRSPARDIKALTPVRITRPHAAGIQDPLKGPSVVEPRAPEPSLEPRPPGSDPDETGCAPVAGWSLRRLLRGDAHFGLDGPLLRTVSGAMVPASPPSGGAGAFQRDRAPFTDL